MRKLFWTGKASFFSKLAINTAGILGWLVGNSRDVEGMKARVRDGYNGRYSEHVYGYGKLGGKHYSIISDRLLSRVDCRGRVVADIGCGMGVTTVEALKKGASNVVSIDASRYMLSQCRNNVAEKCLPNAHVTYCEGDAETLPFPDSCFDVVLSSMVVGMLPNQLKALSEMARVLRPHGMLAIATHGPEHYREAIDAAIRVMSLRHFVFDRLEFWKR